LALLSVTSPRKIVLSVGTLLLAAANTHLSICQQRLAKQRDG
jgi:hypothetical protein